MNIEYIEIVRLTPVNSDNWLTDGQSFGKVVDTQTDNVQNWSEITNEEKEQIEAEQEQQNPEE
ncbi:MAG: hypothetical protein WAO57_08980 [Syntrophomonadaceae bacterium]